jgi:hypothetical protein
VVLKQESQCVSDRTDGVAYMKAVVFKQENTPARMQGTRLLRGGENV